jgi:ATP-dependent 26S proteasome regulatory subunit
MQFIVEFPFPDEDQRRRIWQVTFPSEARLGGDMNMNILAREIRLAGGNIKNIGVTAAFYAASDGGAIAMPHLLRAARREFQKLGRSWSEANTTSTG